MTSLSLGGMNDVRRGEMYMKTEQYVNEVGLRFADLKLKNKQYVTGFVLRFKACRSKGNQRMNSM